MQLARRHRKGKHGAARNRLIAGGPGDDRERLAALITFTVRQATLRPADQMNERYTNGDSTSGRAGAIAVGRQM